MQKNLFRKDSLDRLSSPEQLDQLMTITNPRGWIGLGGIFCLLIVLAAWCFFGLVTTEVAAEGVLLRGEGIRQLNAFHQGIVIETSVEPGDKVKKGEVVAYINSAETIEDLWNDKGHRFPVIAPSDGEVIHMKVEEGDFVSAGQAMLDFEKSGKEKKNSSVMAFLPVKESRRVRPGMETEVYLEGVSSEEYGFIKGKISSVSRYPVDHKELSGFLGDEKMAEDFEEKHSLMKVEIELDRNEKDSSGYEWSSGTSPDYQINSREKCVAVIITSHQRPIDLFLPW